MVTAYYGQKIGENLASRTTSSVFDLFSWNSAQMFALGCRCARHSFWQWQKVCCHGNHILWAKNGGKSCVANYFVSFLTDSHGIRHRCLPWGVDVQDSFWQWQKVCCHGNHISWAKKWGEILRRELLPQFLTDSHGIRHRCLPWGVDVQDSFWQWQKVCCHGNHISWAKNGGKSCVATTSSVFDRFSWNSAQMSAFGCKCARHIFRQWQKVCCHGNGTLFRKWKKTKHLKWKLAQMLA